MQEAFASGAPKVSCNPVSIQKIRA